MSKYLCLAVNGLHEELFGDPLGRLADFINRKTPFGIHFRVVGEADPRPFIFQFQHNIAAAGAAGYKILLIGHSLGAMMMFYLADFAKSRGIKISLLVPIDATDWGTNVPWATPYAVGTSTPGQYWVPDNVDRCLYYRQPVYPGGGYAQLADGNTHTQFEKFERVEPHVTLPILPDIQLQVLRAVQEATQ